jgi:hypothetical protein
VLVLAGEAWANEQGRLSPWIAALLFPISLGLAWASMRFVENPLRYSKRLAAMPGRTLALGLMTSVLVAASALGVARSIEGPAPARPEGSGGPGGSRVVVPPPLTMAGVQFAREDKPVMWATNCLTNIQYTASPACTFGTGDKTIALIGDSHAATWFPAIEEIAKREGWKVLALTKVACPLYDLPIYSDVYKRPYRECADWREDVMKRLKGTPGLVAVVLAGTPHLPMVDDAGHRVQGNVTAQRWGDGVRSTVGRLATEVPDTPIVVLRDYPRPGKSTPNCLADHLDDPAACAFPRAASALRPAQQSEQEAVAATPGASYLDPVPLVCPEETCFPVTDAYVKWMDDNHITASFARSLGEPLREPLLRAIGGEREVVASG